MASVLRGLRELAPVLVVLAAILNCSSSSDDAAAPIAGTDAGTARDAASAFADANTSAADSADSPVPIVPPTFDASKLAYHVNSLDPIEENRVYQRNAQGQIQIAVTINPQVATKKIYYHLTDDKGSSQPWQEELDGAGPTYTITLPQGGPYKIEMFQVDADNFTVSQNSSPLFGVGDAFITAGQSNSANHGDVETTPAESFVMALGPTAKTWAVATNPQPLASKWSDPDFGSSTRASGSPWPTFADAMRKLTGVPIGLVSLGYGGSAASGWQPGSTWTNGAFSSDLRTRTASPLALAIRPARRNSRSSTRAPHSPARHGYARSRFSLHDRRDALQRTWPREARPAVGRGRADGALSKAVVTCRSG